MPTPSSMRMGADAIKFQTHVADAESTLDDQFRVPLVAKTPPVDHWRRMEFTREQGLNTLPTAN